MNDAAQNGVLVDGSTGQIAAVVHGFTGTAPAGQTFQPVADVSGLAAGQVPPTPASQALSASDYEMARGLEDLVAALLTKGAIVKADLPATLVTKINARRALREQAPL